MARVCGLILLGPLVSLLKVFPWFGYILTLGMLPLVVYVPAIYLPVSMVVLAWFARTLGTTARVAEERWKSETVVCGKVM